MKLKQGFKNERGSFSILFVILSLIFVILVIGFIDILGRSWTIQEMQSIMDTSGLSALRASVDETKLRLGEFEVQKNMAESRYKELVLSTIADSKKIKKVYFHTTKIESFTEKWGTGETVKSRPQALLDSSMIVVVSGSTLFDTLPGVTEKFYNSRRSSEFQVTYLGETSDGNIELAIRSVTRLVYR